MKGTEKGRGRGREAKGRGTESGREGGKGMEGHDWKEG